MGGQVPGQGGQGSDLVLQRVSFEAWEMGWDLISFRSFCSGIEAASVAWEPLGMRCLSVAEIDPQASTVLSHRYPNVPNLGDMATSMERMSDERADIFVAGTPCQSFSVAGLRAGMDDPRGNLALVYLGLVDRCRPRWVVWENVPGVLSSNRGRDFGAFLSGLAKLGYGWAYRILDAQFVRVESHVRAIPQRRRRVFVVGCLGDWRGAAAVLLERESMCGHPPPRREAGARVANTLTRGLGSGSPDDNHAREEWLTIDVANAMQARDAKGVNSTLDVPLMCGTLSPGAHPGSFNGQDVEQLVDHTLKAEGHDASEDGTGRGVQIVACFDPLQVTSRVNRSRGEPDVSPTNHHAPMAIASRFGVRRLTPRECERLQGFPDDYTQVPYKGKPMADAARYRMVGNSMAVNVMRWIGERIVGVSAL